MADHQVQQQHESLHATMSQELNFGLALAARKDSREQEECKFDDVMALQEEAIEVQSLLCKALLV